MASDFWDYAYESLKRHFYPNAIISPHDVISKQAVLEALEREREYLLENKMYGAEHILVHHAIRVIEELR